ncbi:hypothetical protein XO10_04875 [Marinitoga sp. 1135]|uniref:hypothetical protein n=1 Tax=Marinitoga sp. 1135 TaxID=1643333 RepID=UPI0015866F18|nr:hypothetical protein [Marinitoga sp. 1135]NUU95612.1 hypothetical protein [Marinitoga sp. 1135]
MKKRILFAILLGFIILFSSCVKNMQENSMNLYVHINSNLNLSTKGFEENINITNIKFNIIKDGNILYTRNFLSNDIKIENLQLKSDNYTLKITAYDNEQIIFYGEKNIFLKYGENQIVINTKFAMGKLSINFENDVADEFILKNIEISGTLDSSPINNFVMNLENFEHIEKELYPGVWDITVDATLTNGQELKNIKRSFGLEILPSTEKDITFIIKKSELGLIIEINSLFDKPYLEKISNITARYDEEKNIITLYWEFSKNAIYKIYKSGDGKNLKFIGKTTQKIFVDNNPSKEMPIYYINAIYDNKESGLYKINVIDKFIEFSLPDGFKYSYEEPDFSANGDWVKFDIYTLNKVTPPDIQYLIMEMDLTEENKEDNRFESYVLLKKEKSPYTDVNKFGIWIYYPKDYYSLKLYNSNNLRFKQLDGTYGQLFGTKDPWYFWSVRKFEWYPFENQHFKVTKLDSGKYLFKTIIRQWENTPILYKKFKVKIIPEIDIDTQTSVVTNYGGIFFYPNSYSGGTIYPIVKNYIKISNNEFEYETAYHEFASEETEKNIGKIETALPEVHKDLFIDAYSYENYFSLNDAFNGLLTDLSKDTIELNVNMHINRIIKLDYEISDNGIFTNDIKELKVNTIYSYSISDQTLKEKLKYNNPYLIDINEIDFDMNNTRELRFYAGISLRNNLYYQIYPNNNDVSEVYIASYYDFESIINYDKAIQNMSEYHYNNLEIGDVILYKTKSGKFIKIRIKDIYPMPKEEIEALGITVN